MSRSLPDRSGESGEKVLRRAWIGAVVSAGAFTWDAAWLLPLARQEISPLAAACGHIVLVLLLALATLAARRLSRDTRLLALLLITTAFIGPFGAIGTFSIALTNIWHKRLSRPFLAWYETLFPRQSQDRTEQLYETVRSLVDHPEDGSAATPFVDVMASGQVEEKQTAIALMTRYFRPAFGPILERALQDQTAAVRVQAAAAMARIESRFLTHALELEELIEEESDLPEHLLALARHHDDHAFTGLLDGSRRQEARDAALKSYKQFLEFEPQHEGARLAVGRLLVRENRYADAASWFESAFEEGFPSARSALWYMDSLFHMGRFSDLRAIASEHIQQVDMDDSFPFSAKDAFALWARPELSHAGGERA